MEISFGVCKFRLVNSNLVQGVQEKLCFFFHNSLQPLLAYIAVRDLHSSQHNSSVQKLLLHCW